MACAWPGSPRKTAISTPWRRLRPTIARLSAVVWDKQAKDISRLCYVSYDPECHIHSGEPTVFPVPDPAPKPARKPRPELPSTPDRERIESALRCIPAEDRETWLHMGMALHST